MNSGQISTTSNVSNENNCRARECDIVIACTQVNDEERTQHHTCALPPGFHQFITAFTLGRPLASGQLKNERLSACKSYIEEDKR